jgi:hypothetical protein
MLMSELAPPTAVQALAELQDTADRVFCSKVDGGVGSITQPVPLNSSDRAAFPWQKSVQ